MTKINIKINSRIYTVVAEEDKEYLMNLCDYVNEKVNTVIAEGVHVTGEKPIVLAALNICDEYFKLLNSKVETESIPSELMAERERLEAEIRDLNKTVRDLEEKNKNLSEELELTSRVLEEEEANSYNLMQQIKEKDEQIKRQKSDFAIKQKELLSMVEESKRLK